jgi:3-oxoadipate enol-lactonase
MSPIRYTVEGPAEAPVLLLINSIGTTRDLWAPQVASLSQAHRLIRYDARGHGASVVSPGDYTIEQLGRDALAILDREQVAAAHVCGISLGGLTAMWLGVNEPTRVRSLVLANTAARIGSVQSWTERIALVRERGMTAVADLALPLWFSPAFAARHRDTVARFRALIESCPIEGYLGCCAALRDEDLRGAIATITCPVLAIAGSRDMPTPPDALAFIRDQIPGARLATLDAAHLSNVEQAEAFTAAVSAFLRQQSAVGGGPCGSAVGRPPTSRLLGDRHLDRLAQPGDSRVQVVSGLNRELVRSRRQLHLDDVLTVAEVNPGIRLRNHRSHRQAVGVDSEMEMHHALSGRGELAWRHGGNRHQFAAEHELHGALDGRPVGGRLEEHPRLARGMLGVRRVRGFRLGLRPAARSGRKGKSSNSQRGNGQTSGHGGSFRDIRGRTAV